MRYLLILLTILLCPINLAQAEVSFGVNIGINVPAYPEFVPIPGYPVYYAPQVDSNYFFYDGRYWVFMDDDWYESSWYNGPWDLVEPEYVPLFILRIPVHYYRQPPVYFHGWRGDAPPHWGEHWGRDWDEHRRGWDKWDRRSAPSPAPLPGYQRQYMGDRYPHEIEQQHSIHSEHYHYQPREALPPQHFQQQMQPNQQRHGPQDKDREQGRGREHEEHGQDNR